MIIQQTYSTLNIKNKTFIIFMLALIISPHLYAVDYYQRQTGVWQNPLTWTTNPSFNAIENTGTYPQAGDNVYLSNNGNNATIYLFNNVEIANLFFNNSSAVVVIQQNEFDLTITSQFSVDWSANITINQTTGYLQVNGAINQFNTEKTIKNFRVGSTSFTMNQTNSIQLIITDNYDYYCYQSTIPAGLNANTATKQNLASACTPHYIQPAVLAFGNQCVGSSGIEIPVEIHGLALQAGTITVGPQANFSFATTANGSYNTSLSFNLAAAGNIKQGIYVKYSTQLAQNYTSDFPVSGGGAVLSISATATGKSNIKPTINNQTSKTLTLNSVQLNSEIIKAGCGINQVTERGFYYSTSSGFDPNTASKVNEFGSFGTGNYGLKVDNLQKNQWYYYRAYAANSDGQTVSEELPFKIDAKKYFSRKNGNWDDTEVWTTQSCGGSLNTGSYPRLLDTVVICDQHQLTINVPNLSCCQLDMSAYNTKLILNNDFKVLGNAKVTNQSTIIVGNNNLTIKGDFTNLPIEYLSSIDYSDGMVTVEGNIAVSKNNLEPFNCTGNGWLSFSGTTIQLNNNIVVPRFKQPKHGYSIVGAGALTVSTVFDQNFSFEPPTGVVISIPANTINKPTAAYRTTKSAMWNDASAWEQSNNGGETWIAASMWPNSILAIAKIRNTHSIQGNSNISTAILEVEAGAQYQGLANSELDITNTLTNNGTIQLTSDATGTAAVLLPNRTIGTGSYNYVQTFTDNRNYYISLGFKQTVLPVGPIYFRYVEATQSGDINDYWQNTTNSPGAAQGFILKPTGTNQTYTFTGDISNDSIKTILSNTGLIKKGFNLSGNPYMGYLDASTLNMGGLENSLWLRTYANSSYSFHTVNTNTGIGTFGQTLTIPPMQAFWVRTTGAAQLSFTNAMRQSGSTILLKAKKAQTYPVLNLQISAANLMDETIIYQHANASENKDIYDSQKMNNESETLPELYTLAQTEKLAINALPSLTADIEIPLGFKTATARTNFVIKLNKMENFDSNLNLYLYDGSQAINLSNNSQHQFASDVYDGTDRFKLVIKSQSPTTNPQTNANNIRIYTDKNANIYVKWNSNENFNFKLHTLYGQLLQTRSIENGNAKIASNLKHGVYIVELYNDNLKLSRKIVIN